MRQFSWFVSWLLCSHILVADFNPPAWRNLPGTTYQRWEFSVSAPLPIADDYSNPYGSPTVTNSIVGNWYDQVSNHQGIWYSETISFSVPIAPETLNDTKYRIQMVWMSPTIAITNVSFFARDSGGIVPATQAEIIDQYYDLGWTYTTFEMVAAPLDSIPILYFEAKSKGNLQSVYVDEIIIDSILIPEPNAFVLLSIGAVITATKKRTVAK